MGALELIFLKIPDAPNHVAPIWPARGEPRCNLSSRDSRLPAWCLWLDAGATHRLTALSSCVSAFFLPLCVVTPKGEWVQPSPKEQGGYWPCARSSDPGLSCQQPRHLLTQKQRDEPFHQNLYHHNFVFLSCTLSLPSHPTYS